MGVPEWFLEHPGPEGVNLIFVEHKYSSLPIMEHVCRGCKAVLLPFRTLLSDGKCVMGSF